MSTEDNQDRSMPEQTADSAVPPTQRIPSDDPLAEFHEPVVPAAGPTSGTGTTASSASSAASPEPAGTTAADPVAGPYATAPLVRTGPRSTTIVWGLIVIAVGVGLIARAAGAVIDVELAAILLLAAAGVLLVVGSVASAVRRRRSPARA